MKLPILTMSIQFEEDVVAVRQKARLIADMLGFETLDETHIATSVSEIARNAFNYGGGGKVEFVLEGATAPQVLLIRIVDHGPGIPDLQSILSGRYRSQTGMGQGILGARRLMDQFRIESSSGGGTAVNLRKILPKGSRLRDQAAVTRIQAELHHKERRTPMEEVREQNQELLRALEELKRRQDELARLNGELEDTNRGVVALYAELDEKADHLRRADELKSRFLSNMSHEFRTPLNSIQALCRLLLDRTDGDLSNDQEKQVKFISKAADDLSQLVNDLLDLAKVEAGKIVVHPAEFQVADLFGALRGMLRPLLLNEALNLVFEEPVDVPALHTDEGKVSQILRNFISNAIKFTERGEVRVSASLSPDRETVVFSVCDTGIGIDPKDHELIFQEFTQVENPIQKRVKGTGLGLPLCRKLAGLLGGSVSVKSELGLGSTFSATIPLAYRPPVLGPVEEEPGWEVDPLRTPVLVLEDSDETVFIYRKLLNGSGFQLLAARNLKEARQAIEIARPAAVILDILLKGEDSWAFLAELKDDPATRTLPVVVISTVEDRHKVESLGADAYCVKPAEKKWLVGQLRRLTSKEPERKVLVVDDDEVSRYLLRQFLSNSGYGIIEAQTGLEAIRRAREDQPDLVILDLTMPGMSGFDVLEQLKADARSRGIPIVIFTSRELSGEERRQLEVAATVLPKAEATKDGVLEAVRRALEQGSQLATTA